MLCDSNEKIPNGRIIMSRALLDEICLFVHSKLLISCTFRDRQPNEEETSMTRVRSWRPGPHFSSHSLHSTHSPNSQLIGHGTTSQSFVCSVEPVHSFPP